jgi:hypothetical protein
MAKVVLTFKTPDAVSDALKDLTPGDAAAVEELAEKYVEYGEYVHVELDTEKQTCRVRPVKKG